MVDISEMQRSEKLLHGFIITPISQSVLEAQPHFFIFEFILDDCDIMIDIIP